MALQTGLRGARDRDEARERRSPTASRKDGDAGDRTWEARRQAPHSLARGRGSQHCRGRAGMEAGHHAKAETDAEVESQTEGLQGSWAAARLERTMGTRR